MKIKELLSDGSKWCQGGIAKDACGNILNNADSKTAVSWCLMGAAFRCYPSNYEADRIIDLIHLKLKMGVPNWNDDKVTDWIYDSRDQNYPGLEWLDCGVRLSESRVHRRSRSMQ